MRIYMLIYLVWIIMFNSWYKHGMGKTWFKSLEFSLWITLINLYSLQYISPGLCSFQPNRSAADVVWIHLWLAATCRGTQGRKVHITGIDMSEAFDTINHDKLLHILSDSVIECELRIIRFLLSNTVISMNINGTTNITPSQQTLTHLKEMDWAW